MRTVQAGPLTGLIAQLLLLAALAGTVGLGSAGWVVGVACAVIMNAALARGVARYGSDAARPGRLGDAHAGHARRRRRGAVADSFEGPAPVALLVSAHGRRARARLGRRLDRATHRHGIDARRALRRRGRRVPDRSSSASTSRRSAGAVGARDRRDALRVPRRRLAAAVDARSRCRRATGARSSPRRRASCSRSRQPTSCRSL